MTTPMYRMRTVRGRGEITQDVTLMMPGTKPAENRKPNAFYVEDHLPISDDRHICLGKFVDAWGYLENIVLHSFIKLLQTDFQSAKSVFNGLGMKQVIDSVASLSIIRLNDEKISELGKLLDRLSKLNAKRNTLVHGHWMLEIFIYGWKGEPRMNVHLFRSSDPADRRILDKISDPRNQKERLRYNYTLERIDAVTRDTQKLASDFASFNESIGPDES